MGSAKTEVKLHTFRIRGSQSCGYEEFYLLGYKFHLQGRRIKAEQQETSVKAEPQH
jgi:hypothetical protein